MQEFEVIKIREEQAVLFASIDNPPINLLGPGLVRDLVSLIRILDQGDKYKVVVFSSANPNYFIPHVDVTKIAEYRAIAAELVGEPSLSLLYRRLSETKAVTIAQIAGRVRGAGSEFVLACDMRFASKEKAIFGQLEAAFGQVPGSGGVQHLTRLMGRGRAFEVITSSTDYSADLAERYGWINRAMPDAELDVFVSDLARRIARFPHQGLIDIKQRINAIALASAEDYRIDSDLFGKATQNPETKARYKSILEKGFQLDGKTELNLGEALGEL
ncbi:enoyl-CoA hydratase/isomerase family protein [Mucilaginibacter sp.]|jgi:enoyl-CoA hydratase/carnithine racemase|uniref:enoyl-CoA hydratase/isomerase family protein n=1 Tax=Mucilaginibacter sp. TaxID=1882438 RepID=UPI003561E5FB